MGCPTQVVLSNNLTFSVSTHNPATAALTDADALPAYRVYEELVATPILTGTMPKLDDPGTTGFYAQTIACTSANGFEAGKNYNIYITAAVGGVTGGITYAFNVGSCLPVAGANEFTYTVVNSATGAPLEGCAVWISTDVAGTSVIWSGTTDALGIARDINGQKPWLDSGTYRMWRQLSGFSFINPDVESVP